MKAERSYMTIIMNHSEYSALLALVVNFDGNDELVRKISQEHRFGLGSNHVEELTQMWAKLSGMEIDTKE